MQTFKLIWLPVVLLFLLGFVLFLVAQISSLVLLADRYNPVLGDVVLWSLCSIVLLLAGIPLFTYLRLPAAQLPPQTNNPEEIASYRNALIRRYQRNSLLRRENFKVETEKDIPAAVERLNRHADNIIQYNTIRTFAGTAISQNGSFDSFIVLYFAMNTVYRVSHVYWQRSSLKQLLKLYSQIALIVVGAKLMEDQLDEYLEENIEEFIDELASQGAETTASVGARATKFIPGFGNVVESLVQGTFNGLMVLRIGLITQKYCGAVDAINRKAIRKESFTEARKRILSIIALPRKEIFSRLNIFSNFFKKERGTGPA